MHKTIQKIVDGFLPERECIIYQRLIQDAYYQKLFNEIQATCNRTKELLRTLSKEDRLFVESCHDDEMLLASLEAKEYYIQGILDGVQLLLILGLIKDGNINTSKEPDA